MALIHFFPGPGSSDPGIRKAIFHPMSKVVEVDGFAQTVYHHARVVWSAEPSFIALLQVQPERRLHRGPRVPAVRQRLEQRGLPQLRRLHQV